MSGRVHPGHDPVPGEERKGGEGKDGNQVQHPGGPKKAAVGLTKVVGLYREEPLGRPTPGLESLRAKGGVYQPYPVTSRN